MLAEKDPYNWFENKKQEYASLLRVRIVGDMANKNAGLVFSITPDFTIYITDDMHEKLVKRY
ncbi:hypothetical protein COT97_05285 [Candidatus Falkowbacteria bacterium CG10_big_fil_rev_8_21_14_0_10_39_11]|uniref:Uncharacterized protein n=1 Tax=Candidatus Falkowbacteria bacterium CG10_big_fil_rev_8_21_14_0_10_39_11 TaxID=1974565 RepID=A0A2H0V3J2_9BACT|nr:MAG: hypothetical protein COT97_05285 [Candidatus Falkowbacteria bacterium CG10_big_fil_rev_8_21_14_0_10_39_11]